jgi:hypothetical protein
MRHSWPLILILLLAGAGSARSEDAAPQAIQAEQPTREQIQKWIADLDSQRYQAREDATAGLLRGGYDAVGPVAQAAEEGGLEVAIRAVYVLRETALSEDPKTAEAAERALHDLSQTRSIAASRAASTLQNLAEMRRRRVGAYLVGLGAEFKSTQRFAGVDPYPDPFGLWIDDNWKGADEDFAKVKFLTHVTRVTLEGPSVTDAWLRRIADLPNLTAVSVKRAKITSAGLAELKRVPNLQELNIFYSPIGDGAIEQLTSLRGLTGLNLYGAGFTPAGEETLRTAFEQTATDLDLRRGAFLGVGCNPLPAGCMISFVREGSAAAKAGLQMGDVIVRYDGKKVEDFEGLTALIALHAPGETSEVEILRGSAVIKKKVTLGEWE